MPDIFRGIFPGALTPFDKMGNLLWDDFADECDWTIRAGAHGFIWPIMASEFTVISHHERVQGIKIAVDTIAGRIPVVIGVADTNKSGAIFFAEKAAEAGADAIIALPPWATKMSDNTLIEDYYRSLVDASGLPLFIQNVGGQLGSGLSSKLVAELCEKIPLAQYVKEERTPPGHKVTELLELAGPGIKGVFSGAGCMGLIGEYKRGIAGRVPSSALTDIDSQIWELLEVDEEEEACEIHNAKLVLENILRSVPLLWGRKTLIGTTQELSIGTAAQAHLGASVPNLDFPSDAAGARLYTKDVVKERIQYEDGHLVVPEGPGLGMEIDEEKLAEVAVSFGG